MTLEITLLHTPGCPRLLAVRDQLTAAIALAGVRGVVTVVEVATPEDALELGLKTSPTILVDGVHEGARPVKVALSGGTAPTLDELVGALRSVGEI